MARIDLSRLDPPPRGFGNCGDCPYRDVGTAPICFTCASATMEPVSRSRCYICDQRLPEPGADCPNPVCNWDKRYFDMVWAIAMRSGELERAIDLYKYHGRLGWAAIFGRVLVGYLDAHEDVFRSTDVIVASPGFGERRHTEEVLRRAAIEAGGRWPFDLGDPPAIIKTHETPPLVGRSWHERREIAEGELRRSLDVPDVSRVRGKDIIVFDDVFTEGFTIREVARCLSEAGASAVSEIVLARQPYR